MQSAPTLYTLQHRLYIYLNTASNLSALMESGGQVSDAVLKSALSAKVIKYTHFHGYSYSDSGSISVHAAVFLKRYYAGGRKGLTAAWKQFYIGVIRSNGFSNTIIKGGEKYEGQKLRRCSWRLS